MEILLVDTRSRFCEVGVFWATRTKDDSLVLRRVISLGSLWDFKPGKFEVPCPVAVTNSAYQAMSSAGFTALRGAVIPAEAGRVAAVIESGGKTIIRGTELMVISEADIYLPRLQPVKHNAAVATAAKNAIDLLVELHPNRLFITEGQSNTFRWAEVLINCEHLYNIIPALPEEHKPELYALTTRYLEDGRVWAERAQEMASVS